MWSLHLLSNPSLSLRLQVPGKRIWLWAVSATSLRERDSSRMSCWPCASLELRSVRSRRGCGLISVAGVHDDIRFVTVRTFDLFTTRALLGARSGGELRGFNYNERIELAIEALEDRGKRGQPTGRPIPSPDYRRSAGLGWGASAGLFRLSSGG